MDAYNKQTSRRKYAKNTDYHDFKNVVWVNMKDGPMPPVKDLIPAEDGDENDDDSDDDLQIGGATQNFRCPLTTNILEDPITKYVTLSILPFPCSIASELSTNLPPYPRSFSVCSTLCKHSYSRSAIQDYVAAGNNRCPASGCQAAVSQRSLKEDPALTKKVAAFKRREEERLIARRQTSTVLY